MITLNEEEIKEINKLCPYGQGIFLQPFGIPDDVNELVVYSSWDSGGMGGGSCWGDEPSGYTSPRPKDTMKVLEIILKRKMPGITFLQYKEIEDLIVSNTKSTWEYYGNYTDSVIEYIPLRQLLNTL